MAILPGFGAIIASILIGVAFHLSHATSYTGVTSKEKQDTHGEMGTGFQAKIRVFSSPFQGHSCEASG